MNEALKTCCPQKSGGTPSVISSQASESGPTPCVKPDGPTTAQSGPDPARANLSVQPEKEKEILTNDISGRYGSRSSRPVDQKQSSENKSLRLTLSGWRERARLKNPEYQRTYRLRHRAQCLVNRIRSRAESVNLPFDLNEHIQDIQARIDANECD